MALPAAEVHISDVTKREPFRQISYAGMACQGHFIGEGLEGYLSAARFLKQMIEPGLEEGGPTYSVRPSGGLVN